MIVFFKILHHHHHHHRLCSNAWQGEVGVRDPIECLQSHGNEALEVGVAQLKYYRIEQQQQQERRRVTIAILASTGHPVGCIMLTLLVIHVCRSLGFLSFVYLVLFFSILCNLLENSLAMVHIPQKQMNLN